MTLYSENIQGSEFILKDSKFDKGQTFESLIQTTQVGKVSQVHIRQDPNDSLSLK
jgi:hypothetical protein